MRTDLNSGARAMARGAVANLAGSAAGMGLAFLLTYVVTQFVPVRGVGFLAIGIAVIGLTLIPAILGLEAGVIRFVALGAAADDERSTRASAQVALGVVTLTSVAFAAFLWWAAPRALAGPLLPQAGGSRVGPDPEPVPSRDRAHPRHYRSHPGVRHDEPYGLARPDPRRLNLALAGLFLALGLGVQGVAAAAVAASYVSFASALVLLAGPTRSSSHRPRARGPSGGCLDSRFHRR